MKRSLLRIVTVLAALMVVSAVLPVYAEYDSYGLPSYEYSLPWWEINPPQVRTRTRTVTRSVETVVESIDAEGYCYTAIKRVNVRSRPSVRATRVQTIRAAGTEFTVSARVKNSSGEIWYAVQLANGTLGYIRSDLLNTDHVILLDDPFSYEEDRETKAVPASESASDILNVSKSGDSQVSDPTPQVIYVTPAPETKEAKPTPTPIIIYVTPEPEVTPQVIYVTQD